MNITDEKKIDPHQTKGEIKELKKNIDNINIDINSIYEDVERIKKDFIDETILIS
jgi:hypothetical protein